MQELATRLERDHAVTVTVHRCDLGRTGDVEALGAACADVDILVNNAGDIPPGTLEEIDGETWRKAWDVKVYGYVDLTRIIYPHMCARKSGVIINIVGAAARTPNHRYIAGCMANIALNMFTQCLGGESMRHNVRVVAINPGPTVPGRHLAARDGARKTSARRREPLAGAAREISVRPRRKGLGDRRGRHVPRLRPRRLHQRRHPRCRWRPFGPPSGA